MVEGRRGGEVRIEIGGIVAVVGAHHICRHRHLHVMMMGLMDGSHGIAYGCLADVLGVHKGRWRDWMMVMEIVMGLEHRRRHSATQSRRRIAKGVVGGATRRGRHGAATRIVARR